MRIVLVGSEAARDRLRPALVEAGIEIAFEQSARPLGESSVDGVDAIVEARPASQALQRDHTESALEEALTAREMDVLERLAEGLTNKAIAHALGISDQTVKFHVAAIIGKLGATNRTDAVRRAVRRGLVAI